MNLTPADLAKRAHATTASAPIRPSFAVAIGYPRRGRRDALTWVDTGVFLSMGVEAGLPDKFVQHYGTQLCTSKTVVAEIRHRYTRTSAAPGDPVAGAAGVVLADLFMPTSRVPFGRRGLIDPKTRDQIVAQLKGLSSDPSNGHGGEADLIAMAVAAKAGGGAPQVLLSNDAGASIVANAHDVPTRHSGDVLAEMACADNGKDPDELFVLYGVMGNVSRVARNARPQSADYMRCRCVGRTCADCDSREV